MTNTTPDRIVEPTSRLNKELRFPAELAPYINWENIAAVAWQIGGHFVALNKRDGSVVVKLFWNEEAES